MVETLNPRGAIYELCRYVHDVALHRATGYASIRAVLHIKSPICIPQRISPTYRLGEAERIYQTLTDGEKDRWIEYGELLLRARSQETSTEEER